jgi:hypothetical protein
MTAMHAFLVVTTAVVATVLAAIGAAGVVMAWAPPWGRAVLRPRLWGAGALLAAVGVAVFSFLGPLNGPHGSYGPLPWAGWAAFMGGLMLQHLGLRPGRAPRPTKTAV